MTTAQEAFRKKFERVIHNDTGAGGLAAANALTEAQKVARLRGLYAGIAPTGDNSAWPRIVYRTRLVDAPYVVGTTTTQAVEIEVTIHIDVIKRRQTIVPGASEYTSGAAHDYGLGLSTNEATIAAILGRLKTLMESPAGGVTWGSTEVGGGVNWVFSTPTEIALPEPEDLDADHTRQTVVHRLTGVQASSSTGLPSGIGFGLTLETYNPNTNTATAGTIYNATGWFAWQLSQSIAGVPITRCGPTQWDLSERITVGRRQMFLAIQFFSRNGQTAFPAVPIVPLFRHSRAPGQTTKATLQLASSRTAEVYGLILQSSLSASRQGGAPTGGFVMRCSEPQAMGAGVLSQHAWGPFPGG